MFITGAPDRETLRAAYAERPTFELERMRYREAGEYSDLCIQVIDEILQQRADRVIGITEKFCVNCGSVNELHAAVCASCGLSCESDKAAEMKEIRAGRRDWFHLLRMSGLIIIVCAMVLAFSTGDKRALGQAAVLFALVLALFVGGTRMGKPKRVSVHDAPEPADGSANSDEDLLYVLCPGCREQVFLELHPKRCPTCGTPLRPDSPSGLP